jgi:hypothetical protein
MAYRAFGGLGCGVLGFAVLAAATPGAHADTIVLPTVDVVPTTPLARRPVG